MRPFSIDIHSVVSVQDEVREVPPTGSGEVSFWTRKLLVTRDDGATFWITLYAKDREALREPCDEPAPAVNLKTGEVHPW